MNLKKILIILNVFVLCFLIFVIINRSNIFLNNMKDSFYQIPMILQDSLWKMEIKNRKAIISYESDSYEFKKSGNTFTSSFSIKNDSAYLALSAFLQSFQMAQGNKNNNFDSYLMSDYKLYTEEQNINLTFQGDMVTLKVNTKKNIKPNDLENALFSRDNLEIFLYNSIHEKIENMQMANGYIALISKKEEDKLVVYIAEKYQRTSLTIETLSSLIQLAVGEAEQIDFIRDYKVLSSTISKKYQIEVMADDFYIPTFGEEEENFFPDDYRYTKFHSNYWD